MTSLDIDYIDPQDGVLELYTELDAAQTAPAYFKPALHTRFYYNSKGRVEKKEVIEARADSWRKDRRPPDPIEKAYRSA